MKTGPRDIVGKKITQVVITEYNMSGPSTQVFLVFSDDSCFEFYGNQLEASAVVLGGGLDRVLEDAKAFGGKITVYGAD